MAAYTMQLRTYIERFSQGESLSHSERIEKGRPYLFDFDYPLFNEEYRKEFETHFIRHFYMREIGSETEELFKFRLETWLQINMPYYNKLFESELIEYDPLVNTETDVTANTQNDKAQTDNRTIAEKQTGTGNSQAESQQNQTSETDGTVTNDDFSRQIYSDTPDSRLALTTNDGEGVLEYATNITENNENDQAVSHTSSEGQSTATSNQTATSEQDRSSTDAFQSDINENEDFKQHTRGKIGDMTYAQMIMQHRATFLRIEKQLFDEMERLFMLVY